MKCACGKKIVSAETIVIRVEYAGRFEALSPVLRCGGGCKLSILSVLDLIEQRLARLEAVAEGYRMLVP